MWFLVSFVVAMQFSRPAAVPTAYQILAAEYARSADPANLAVFDAAIASGDTALQRLAVRAIGRLENPELVPHITPMLNSPSPAVRRETLNAYGQMKMVPPVGTLESERDGSVRSVLYETLGRTVVLDETKIRQLLVGLTESDMQTRVGAARGMESVLRRTARASRPEATTLAPALRTAFAANTGAEIRQLLLLSLTALNDRDSATMMLALRDTSAQVRRLAVLASREWVENDPSPLVRYQTVRVAANCEQAASVLGDSNLHVVLAAVDVMGEKRCAPRALDSLARMGSDWRVRAHAVVALARSDTARARMVLKPLATSQLWQARTYAATAARLLHDSVTLATLARDTAPNVAIAAMTTTADALRGLTSTHFGLVLASANQLRGTSLPPAHQQAIVDALLRLSRTSDATSRDPRMALLQRLLDSASAFTAAKLTPLLRDRDPDVAALAARIMSAKSGTDVRPVTTRYAPASFPLASTLDKLRGATARIQIRGVGTMDMALFPDDAAVTVATFAELAEKRVFNGLTWHRIVPVFVVQGGSPGANEYDGLTRTFMRDEVGMARNARGSFGTSTRGRDTGDGQIYINLVDNFRLDHDYTVFGQIRRGLDVMDRIQEGDIIESITIIRAR